MILFYNTDELSKHIAFLKGEGKSIGFVPTMGALHIGHTSLIEKAKQLNQIIVCSIYINPLQFNNTNDFEKYPRLIEEDIRILKDISCDIVYIPDDSIINESEHFDYHIGYLDKVMEGYYRPNHFIGVAYIVKKLFEIVKPDNAYFGEKDYQQLAVVREMTKYFNLNVQIISCPTIREADGLAYSSRNARLTQEERKTAPQIFEALQYIKNNISKYSIKDLKLWFKQFLEKGSKMKVEYIEICDADSMKILDNISESSSVVVCTAVFLGNVRLIDNIKIFSNFVA